MQRAKPTASIENKIKFVTTAALRGVDSPIFDARLNKQNTAESQQIELLDKFVNRTCQSLCSDKCRWSRQCSKVQQLQFINKLSEIPLCKLCRKQVQFFAKVVDPPVVVSGRPKPNKTSSPATLFDVSVTHHCSSQPRPRSCMKAATRRTSKLTSLPNRSDQVPERKSCSRKWQFLTSSSLTELCTFPW